MQVDSKIDHLITELTKLKPALSDGSLGNEKRFSDLLTASLEGDRTISNKEIEAIFSENVIPSWVDPDYGYDPQNPRKPNMRELMEAMSRKSLEDLHKEPDESWQKISRQASRMLFGVIGANEDTRDWPTIMSSSDILTEAREQTGAMYKPEVDIQSIFDDDGILTEQMAVIKDKDGNTLSSLSFDIASAEETLLDFGATQESIPTNLEERINPKKFDYNLLDFLKNFDNKPTTLQQVVHQSATEAIENKLSQDIPLEELDKL